MNEEVSVKFGFLTYQEMLKAIESGILEPYNICYTRDSHEQFIITNDLRPFTIKSKMPVYSSVESAITEINADEGAYVGELVSIFTDGKFKAYIINEVNNQKIVELVFDETQIDYDKINNTPIINLMGTSSTPIKLKDLEDGTYNIKGIFITPDNTQITSIVGNLVLVSDNSIKTINNAKITDYVIAEDETVTVSEYITDKYIETKGYATTSYVDVKVEALKISLEEELKAYVIETVTQLVQQIVDQTLDSRECKKSDIENLFNY